MIYKHVKLNKPDVSSFADDRLLTYPSLNMVYHSSLLYSLNDSCENPCCRYQQIYAFK